MIIELILLLVVGVFFFYRWSSAKNDFFDKRNIPCEKPFMFFGNFLSVLLRKESMFDVFRRMQVKFANSKIYGIFEFRNPILVINDPEFIKKITVKDFDHFTNHRIIVDEIDEPLVGSSLLNLRDQKWKDMRATLTPAFTGNKLRMMFQLMLDICEESSKYLRQESKLNPNGIVLDIKDFFNRFANDVIATTAFGIKVNSLEDKDNEFYRMGKKITSISTVILIKFFLFTSCRALMRFFKMRLLDAKLSNYFTRLVLDAMKYRIDNGIVRPDMIHMLIEARTLPEKSHNREWTDDEIVAQCFLFFLGGFDSSATIMYFAARELMENRDVQEKLIAEVDDVKEQLNGKPLTYEVLNGMKYLDMVLSETLRKWPSAVYAADRVCTKPYVLNDGERDIIFEVNDVCWINIVGLHYDPKYFPNPDKFEPDRFGDEKKANISPHVYAPFGFGPRSCIGNRFALMECKSALYYLLAEYTVEVSEKTIMPLKLHQGSAVLKPDGGYWLKLCPRN